MAIDDPPSDMGTSVPSESVRVLVIYRNGRRASLAADASVLRQNVLVRLGDAYFSHRGDNLRFGKWHRIFVQCDVIKLK